MRGWARSSSRRSAVQAAFTIVEIVIVSALVLLVAAYLAQTFIFASRSERAVTKKAISARALQYLQGRIRRDARWARTVRILGGSAGAGPGVELSDFLGATRRYQWDRTTKVLTIPELTNPSRSEAYGSAKFRYALFYITESGAEGLRVVLAPLNPDENLAIETPTEQLWGCAMVGRTELDGQSVLHRYCLFNEPLLPAHPCP